MAFYWVYSRLTFDPYFLAIMLMSLSTTELGTQVTHFPFRVNSVLLQTITVWRNIVRKEVNIFQNFLKRVK